MDAVKISTKGKNVPEVETGGILNQLEDNDDPYGVYSMYDNVYKFNKFGTLTDVIHGLDHDILEDGPEDFKNHNDFLRNGVDILTVKEDKEQAENPFIYSIVEVVPPQVWRAISSGGDPMKIDGRLFEVLLNVKLDPIDILYIPSVEEIIQDRPVLNVFSDETLQNSFQDLFNDRKKAMMLFQAHKRLIQRLLHQKNNRASTRNKLIVTTGSFKTLTDNDATDHDADEEDTSIKSLAAAFEDSKRYSWDEYINKLNNLLSPIHFDQDTNEILVNEDTELEVAINEDDSESNRFRFIVYGSLDPTRVPYTDIYHVLKTSLDSSLIDKLVDRTREYLTADGILALKPSTNELDHLDSFFSRLGGDFYDMTQENMNYINNVFKRERALDLKYSKIDLKPLQALLRVELNFFKAVKPFEDDVEGLKEQLKALSERREFSESGEIDFIRIMRELETKERSIEDVQNQLKRVFQNKIINEAMLFLKDCIDSSRVKESDIQKHIEWMDTIHQEYTRESIYKSSKLKSEIKEIIEGNNDNFRSIKYVSNQMEFEENMDFEVFGNNSADPEYFDIDQYINEYSCYKEYSKVLRVVIPTLIQLQNIMNIPIDISKILQIITMPYLGNQQTQEVNETDVFNYAVSAIYLVIQENIVKDTFVEPDWLNSTCMSYWSMTDPPTHISESEVKPNGILNYIVCCIFEISNLATVYNTTDDLMGSISDIILKAFSEWYNDILYEFEKKGTQKKKKNETFNKAIDSFIEKQDSSNYVKALLYMPNSRLQKQINKRVMGCCKQRLSSEFRAFSDLNQTDNKLRYLKDYMNKGDKARGVSWKAKAFNAEVEDNKGKTDYTPPKYVVGDFKETFNIHELADRYKDILDDELLRMFFENRHSHAMAKHIDAILREFERAANKKNKLFRDFFTDRINVRSFLVMVIDIDYNGDMREDIRQYTALLNDLNKMCKNTLEAIDQIRNFRLVMGLSLLKNRQLSRLRNVNSEADRLPSELRYTKMFERYISNENLFRLAPVLFNKIVNFQKNMSIPTEEEYKAYAAKMREEYKIAALNILDTMDRDERKMMIDLKKSGLFDYMGMLPINKQKTDDDKDLEYEGEFKYEGEDNNYQGF